MNISNIKPGERVKDVRFAEDSLNADLMDGRTSSTAKRIQCGVEEGLPILLHFHTCGLAAYMLSA